MRGGGGRTCPCSRCNESENQRSDCVSDARADSLISARGNASPWCCASTTLLSHNGIAIRSSSITQLCIKHLLITQPPHPADSIDQQTTAADHHIESDPSCFRCSFVFVAPKQHSSSAICVCATESSHPCNQIQLCVHRSRLHLCH